MRYHRRTLHSGQAAGRANQSKTLRPWYAEREMGWPLMSRTRKSGATCPGLSFIGFARFSLIAHLLLRQVLSDQSQRWLKRVRRSILFLCAASRHKINAKLTSDALLHAQGIAHAATRQERRYHEHTTATIHLPIRAVSQRADGVGREFCA